MERQRGRQKRAADTIADCVDLVAVGHLPDRVERESDAFTRVRFPVFVRMPLVRVDPGDDEHGVPLFHGPLDEGFLRVEVENVELVDPGRNDEKRALQHRLCRRVVLEDLADLVLGDHLAGRERHVLADLEFGGVGLAQLELAAAGCDVFREHVHAANEVAAVLGNRLLVEFRVGQQEVRRRKRARHLLEIEFGLVARPLVETVGAGDQPLGPAGGELVGVAQEVEERIVVPVGIAEALVRLAGRRFLGFLLVARQFVHRARPETEIACQQLGLGGNRAFGIGQPVFADLGESLDHVGHGGGIGVGDLTLFTGLHPGGSGHAELFEHVRNIVGEGFGIFHHIGLDVRNIRLFALRAVLLLGHVLLPFPLHPGSSVRFENIPLHFCRLYRLEKALYDFNHVYFR